MEKDVGKITKNPETDIIIRIDDFGGRRGLTIREYVHSDRYTGFTKSGTRISAEEFENFKHMINSIKSEDMKADGLASSAGHTLVSSGKKFEQKSFSEKSFTQKKAPVEKDPVEDYGIDDEGLM